MVSKNLYTEILPKNQYNLFIKLSESEFIKDFYLAGGTALALYINHRKSDDFDFFTEKDFDINLLSFYLKEQYNIRKLSEEKNTLHCIAQDTKLSFIGFKYKSIGEFTKINNLKIASLQDIAAMKLSAITQRSTKKDFIDLYFLLKIYKLSELFSFYNIKFETQNYNYVLKKSIVYFDYAENDPMPEMIQTVEWEKVKQAITNATFKVQ